MAHPRGADIGVSGCALPDCLAAMGFTSERNPSINLLKIFYNDLRRSDWRSNFPSCVGYFIWLRISVV
jgi:hypothetical protein